MLVYGTLCWCGIFYVDVGHSMLVVLYVGVGHSMLVWDTLCWCEDLTAARREIH